MSTGTSIFPVFRSSCCTAHSSLESQGMVKVPSSCCHTPVKGLVWADVFVTAVTPIFLLLFYLVTNEKDKCWKWRISNVTRAHPARKNLKHRANMEGILFTEFRADWKTHWLVPCKNLSSSLLKTLQLLLFSQELFHTFIPLVIRNLPGISLGFFSTEISTS